MTSAPLSRKLYRAAVDAYVGTGGGTTSFARHQEDAEAYLDNPGFGGSNLYSVRVQVAPETVLDIQDGAPEWLAEIIGNLGAVTEDYAITAVSSVADALTERGYRWVVLSDTYPEGAETWVLLPGDMDMESTIEDAMVEIEPNGGEG